LALVSAIAVLIITCPCALGRTAGGVLAACYPVSSRLLCSSADRMSAHDPARTDATSGPPVASNAA
jgi:hypothetical protein